jgi:AhpD family alkylhydroperoxidase
VVAAGLETAYADPREPAETQPSWLRELMSSFWKTLRRWYCTVRGLMNSCAPIAGVDAAVLTPQPFAVHQVRAGEMDGDPIALESSVRSWRRRRAAAVSTPSRRRYCSAVARTESLSARSPASAKGSKMADDVQVENRRLDANDNEALIGLARMGADAFGYTADLRVDRQLAQLLRLRVSQLNSCSYCLNLHYEAAREAGIPRAKIDTLTAWWETELHSKSEQAALRYAEALTRAADTDRDAAFQRFHDALAENFSPEEILEIVGIVVNMNVWTRIKLAEGAMPGPA